MPPVAAKVDSTVAVASETLTTESLGETSPVEVLELITETTKAAAGTATKAATKATSGAATKATAGAATMAPTEAATGTATKAATKANGTKKAAPKTAAKASAGKTKTAPKTSPAVKATDATWTKEQYDRLQAL